MTEERDKKNRVILKKLKQRKVDAEKLTIKERILRIERRLGLVK